MINYIQGDLFDSPDKYLLHACNGKAVWGSGVAKSFRDRFPASFEEYYQFCHDYRAFSTKSIRGSYLVCEEENGKHVICLFTSQNYGDRVDAPSQILASTHQSLFSVCEYIQEPISMPKINSGLFKTPWTMTEKVLDMVGFEKPEVIFNVYSMESK